MNHTEFATVICWHSRNSYHRTIAQARCQDYGLQEVQPSVHMGILSMRARQELEGNLRQLFNQKHERVSFFTACRSCIVGATLGMPEGEGMIRDLYQEIGFELVQTPKIP